MTKNLELATKTQDEKQPLTQAEIAQEKLKEELLSQIRGVNNLSEPSTSLASLQATLNTASARHQEEGENQGKLINQEGYIIANNQEEFVREIFFNTGLNSAQKVGLLITLDGIISYKNLIFNSIFNELNN
jgi:chromosome condensin MukBEF complex kleisin-like MukF subunit